MDADCYEIAHRYSEHDTQPGTIDDREVLNMCAPKADSKSFEVVPADGTELKLDSKGAQKARELVTKTPKTSRYKVTVTGATLEVDDIVTRK